jgi:uncharacterized integral membrane protein
MVRIIVTIVLVVLIAVLIAMNIPFKTELNLFGARFTDVPVVAVAALSFALGIVYSLFIYFTRFLRRRAKSSMDSKKKSISEREQKLAEKEASAPPAAPPAGGGGPAGPGRQGLFGRKQRP